MRFQCHRTRARHFRPAAQVGTAYCRAVRKNFAAVTYYEIVDAGFSVDVTAGGADFEITLDDYLKSGGSEALVLKTEYDVAESARACSYYSSVQVL